MSGVSPNLARFGRNIRLQPEADNGGGLNPARRWSDLPPKKGPSPTMAYPNPN